LVAAERRPSSSREIGQSWPRSAPRVPASRFTGATGSAVAGGGRRRALLVAMPSDFPNCVVAITLTRSVSEAIRRSHNDATTSQRMHADKVANHSAVGPTGPAAAQTSQRIPWQSTAPRMSKVPEQPSYGRTANRTPAARRTRPARCRALPS